MEKLAPSERHQFIHGGQVVYEWDQTVDDVNVYIRTPPGLKASMMRVDIQSKKLSVGVKGEKPYIDEPLENQVKVSECTWTHESGELNIALQKLERGKAWGGVFVGHSSSNPFETEADKKRLLLERFQAEHPGFDFSGADVTGQVPDAATFMGGIGATR